MEQPHNVQVVGKFSTIAREYQQGQARRLNLPLITRLAQPRPSDRVLDVATGTGAVLLGLAPKVASVVGIDVARPMLEAAVDAFSARGNGKPKLVVGNAPQLPFADQSFDLVTCSRALHHMTHPQVTLAEIARVLKPGGRLFILDNLTYEEPDFAAVHNRIETIRDSSHARTLSFPELLALVRGAGLEVRSAMVDEVLRPVTVWLDDAGADSEESRQIRAEMAAGVREGDQFMLRHFQRMADGEWRFRYRMAWVLAIRLAPSQR